MTALVRPIINEEISMFTKEDKYFLLLPEGLIYDIVQIFEKDLREDGISLIKTKCSDNKSIKRFSTSNEVVMALMIVLGLDCFDKNTLSKNL